MYYRTFHCTRIGAEHIRVGMPCQDASATEYHNGFSIAVVADGHGSSRHFRSDRGSRYACSIAVETICKMLDDGFRFSEYTEQKLTELKQDICTAWSSAVIEDYRKDPLSEADLLSARDLMPKEQYYGLLSGEEIPICYGSTLCAVFANDSGWAAIQLGDGAFACIRQDGEFFWPMPESTVNLGALTASLCMYDPMRDFRHCSGKDPMAGFLVYTDGIEKVFPPCSKEVTSLLHWIWNNERINAENHDQNLIRTLDTLTSKSPYGDDLSVAGIVDPDAGEIMPKAGRQEQLVELRRIRSRIAEVDGAISYNIQKLESVCNSTDGTHSEAADQIIAIIEKREKELDMLNTMKADILKQLETGSTEAASRKE